MRKLVLAVFLSTAMFSGCATLNKPTPEQISKADYGSYPSTYKKIVQDYMSKVLIDPYSAEYSNWRGPSSGWASDMNGAYFGYRVCVSVNSKNRMGGYVGAQTWYFMLNNGRIIQSEGGSRYGTVGSEMVSNTCSSVY